MLGLPESDSFGERRCDTFHGVLMVVRERVTGGRIHGKSTE